MKKNNFQVDYKDIVLLKKYLDPYARILSRKRTKTSAKNQRMIQNAIKRARFLALLPFIKD